jgi:anti-sigma-K factor RskA
MTTRGHEEHIDSAGAYLLGALPELEAQAFERHMAGCHECMQEVERLRVAAEALPRSVEPIEPPPGLRATLMETVMSEAGQAARPARERRPFFRLPRLSPSLAWVSAAFLLAVGVLVGWGATQIAGDDERTLAAEVDSSRLQQASGTLEVDEDGEGAVLRLQGMPRPEPGQVLQAWVERGSEILPSTVFATRSDGTAVAAITVDLDGVDRVMVTREAPGGASRPGEDPPVVVEL